MEQISILVLDDEHRLRDELEEFLSHKNFLVYKAAEPSEAFDQLEKHKIDIAIVDIKLPQMSGLEVLHKIKESWPKTEVIMISGHGDMKSVIEALRQGANDYFEKPFRLADIEQAIHRTKRFINLSRQLTNYNKSISLLTKRLYETAGAPMIGKSSVIKDTIMLMEKVAQADSTSVLVLGESGTGKELVAHGIHLLSGRKDELFHSVNCSAITDSLFESEFFGHKKGSFTGAVDDRSGWFEIANGGTLFLDEIGDMPIRQQAKLLRALEERKVSRVGSHQKIPFDVRVIAASNQNLEKMADEKKFRSDLFHRLSTFIIQLPPLKERKEDIPLLTDHFLTSLSAKMNKKKVMISENALQKLLGYDFPGNIRELRNILERAVILSEQGLISASDIPLSKSPVSNHSDSNFDTFNLEEIEKETIQKALKKCKNNKSQTAKLLNLTWQSLNRKIEKHKL